VTRAARLVLEAGADGITVHPRPDARHIRASDVVELGELLRAWPDREYNVEGNPFHNLMDFVRQVRPHQCTLVPDESGQFTSDHGWDIAKDGARLVPIIAELRELGVRVSLFMDPIPQSMEAVKELGADRIELYTEPYAAHHGGPKAPETLAAYVASAAAAAAIGLGVNAGHDLNLQNLPAFVAAIPSLEEVSIGHALVADALEFGLEATVKKYLVAASAG